MHSRETYSTSVAAVRGGDGVPFHFHFARRQLNKNPFLAVIPTVTSSPSNLMIPIPLQLCSYDNSLFTNAHDVISPKGKADGRGTFTHLGVRMEGLESSRHWNFTATPEPAPTSTKSLLYFHRNHRVQNQLVFQVQGSSPVRRLRARIHALEVDTDYYTRNQTRFIYSCVAVDEANEKGVPVSKQIVGLTELEGHSTKRLVLSEPCYATKLILHVGEGGLTRIKALGEVVDSANETGLKDLLDNQAKIVECSDASYGDPSLALRPAREGIIMAGWESCRHSGRHQIGIKLGHPGNIARFEIDTYMHCLNNFPYMSILGGHFAHDEEFKHALSALPPWKIRGSHLDGEKTVPDKELNLFVEHHSPLLDIHYAWTEPETGSPWCVLLPMVPLKRDTLHEFESVLESQTRRVSHIVVVGVPDGGIHRLGVYGRV